MDIKKDNIKKDNIKEDNIKEDDIITTDRYKTEFPDNYYKTELIINKFTIYTKTNTPRKTNINLLITGHSDRGITDELADFYSPKIWFTINKETTRPTIFSLPLGITNDTNESNLHRIYGNKECMIQVMSENIEIKSLVYMNINIATYPSERQIVWDMFKNYPWVKIGKMISTIEGRIQYLRDIKSCDFVLCPRGNGIDTHRLWETLYMGRIPIVRRSVAMNDFSEDFPICFIDSWEEITPEFLISEKERIYSREWNKEALKIGYWLEKIRKAIV